MIYYIKLNIMVKIMAMTKQLFQMWNSLSFKPVHYL